MVFRLNQWLDQLGVVVEQSRHNLGLTLSLVGIFWLIYIINLGLGQRLFALALIPREARGLPGIIFAPFLHANLQHLLFNSIPLFLLINLLLLYGQSIFIITTTGIIVLSGVAVWCLGRRALHLGASGLVMGYWGFLLFNAYLHPNVMGLFVVLLCLYYLGGLALQIVPRDKGVSWEGHLFGLAAGILMAKLVAIYSVIHFYTA